MDKEEMYLDRLENRRIAMTSYESLTDQAHEEAYDELVEHIQENLALVEAQDYLIQIAVIWRGKGSTQEKYALIADIFEAMVTSNAENKMRGM